MSKDRTKAKTLSLAHGRTMHLLKHGYRLAFEPKYTRPFGKRSTGAWWLTCGSGQILGVAESVAKRLVKRQFVKKWKSFGDGIVYYVR